MINATQPDTRRFLSEYGISYRESGPELIAKCVFSDCDVDSKGVEAHLYISADTGQYHCKKCGAKGNLITLKDHLQGRQSAASAELGKEFKDLVKKCHKELPTNIRDYLRQSGLTDDTIDYFELGYGQFYGSNWITIPVRDVAGTPIYFKLRKDPNSKSDMPKYINYPRGVDSLLFNAHLLTEGEQEVVICEGERDAMLLWQQGVTAVTSTAGAGTFKEGWFGAFQHVKKFYVCFDIDEAGRAGALTLTEKLHEAFPDAAIYSIDLPDRVKPGKDITDYFVSAGGNIDEFMLELPRFVMGPEPIDTSEFGELAPKTLAKVLGLTIKKDDTNKCITFVCMLSAYTDEAQFNISFNAPSSSGKSYIPLELAKLMPREDVLELGYVSPSAFFHESGEYEKETNTVKLDLSRKILIFLDQPHNQLLERLRPILSHDQKEVRSKITDKNQRGGNRTKTVVIKGYPAVIFSSAGLVIDEQEATRFFLLSPETNQDKILAAIENKVARESDKEKYDAWVESDPGRASLKRRVLAIKQEKIRDVKITNEKELVQRFLESKKKLKPRHQRDVARLISLIKSFTLLNCWHRERQGDVLIAANSDIDYAFGLWAKVSESQELNLPPYVYDDIYKAVIVPLFRDKNKLVSATGIRLGLSRDEIVKKFVEVHGRYLGHWQLRQQILPLLESSGLILQEPDPADKRRTLIYPVNTDIVS